MNTIILLEYSTKFSIVESWEYSSASWIDRPLSAAGWKMEELTGELMLEELPTLDIRTRDICYLN